MSWVLLSVTVLQLCAMTQGICINASELAACEQEVEKKQQELYYARTTIVNISRVDINLGSSWQFTNSSFNSVVTVVKVENHLGIGCTSCTKTLKELQSTLDRILELNNTGTAFNEKCSTSADLQSCQNNLAELNKELLHVRNASISVQNVTVHPTRTWQYRLSMVNQSITTVKVVNKGNACRQCAERMEKLLAKLQMVADQHPATNKTNVCINTVTFQYQPKSCRDIAKFNPDSPSGYYWLCAEDGILHQIHCLFDEPTENSPALTCKQIKQKLPSSQSGYYWLRNPDGIAVQALCDMED